jgi:hypothetical protein
MKLVFILFALFVLGFVVFLLVRANKVKNNPSSKKGEGFPISEENETNERGEDDNDGYDDD